MDVVDPRVEAGRSLVTPDGRGLVLQDVGERAVEELKELVPFCGVVQSCLQTLETDGIMNQVLKEGRTYKGMVICPMAGRSGALTNLPSRSPYLDSKIGALRTNTSKVSSSSILGMVPFG